MGKMLSPVLALLDRADFYEQPMLAHWCPACGELHAFSCEQPQRNGAQWKWDGNVNFPTFTPSMNIKIGPYGDGRPDWRCHYNLTGGILIFHGDCTHPLGGTRHGLIPIPEGRKQRIEMNEASRGTKGLPPLPT